MCWIDEFYAFDGETALFYGSYIMKSDSFSNELGNCFGIITTSGKIQSVNYTSGFETSFHKGGTLVVGEVDEFDGKIESWTLSKGFKKIALKTKEESSCAMVSEKFKFIATQVYSASEEKVTVKIYDVLSMKQLYKETISANGKLKIDFSELQSCAYIANGKKIIKAEL